MAPKYLITGATGDTGRYALQELSRQGVQVRALVHGDDDRTKELRSLGAEVVVGDLLNFDSVVSALKGIEAAYFVYPILPGLIDATALFIQAAEEADVKSVVNMSQKPARREAKSHASFNHWISERMFDRSELQVTHLQPTFFSEWLTYRGQGHAIAKTGTIKLPFGEGRHAPIAAVDQGRVIAGILQDPAPHAGKSYPLFGPVEMNYHEIAAAVGAAIGRPVTYQPIDIEQFQARLERNGIHPFTIQHLSCVALDYQNGVFAGANDHVERITGQTPLSVSEFVAENIAAFGLSPKS